MSRYASNQEVVRFFASRGITVTDVQHLGRLRHLRVNGQPLTLPMPASPDECLRIVRDCIAAQKAPGTTPPTKVLEPSSDTALRDSSA